MKKVFFALLLAALATSSAFSQVKDNAIGLRFGGGDGVGTEFSYQHGLNSTNRIEADLGFASNREYTRMQITGLYQWVWNIQGELNWYAGLGAGIGHASNKYMNNEFLLNLNGDIGIEYHFDVPLQLSLDFRPAFGTTKMDNSSLGLSLRYTF